MKRALLTGGSRGLGLAVCRRLLGDGWDVTTGSRRLSPELEVLLRQHPERLRHHPVDFSDAVSVETFARQAGALAGFQAYVANAAIGTEGLLTLMSDRVVRECVEVNLIAPMVLARQVVKGMLPGGGSLVFVSSVAARTGLTGLTAYAATKGGLVSFSRALAREYGERGIRSNCVLPGFLETEMSASLGGDQRERLARRTALKRLGSSEDVVGAIVWLLADEARYVTGTEVVVDGGMSA